MRAIFPLGECVSHRRRGRARRTPPRVATPVLMVVKGAPGLSKTRRKKNQQKKKTKKADLAVELQRFRLQDDTQARHHLRRQAPR